MIINYHYQSIPSYFSIKTQFIDLITYNIHLTISFSQKVLYFITSIIKICILYTEITENLGL